RSPTHPPRSPYTTLFRSRKRYTREDLNEKQAAFVDGYIEAGGNRHAATKLVKEIWGYDGNAASVKACELLRNEKIRDVLHNETLDRKSTRLNSSHVKISY